MDPEKNNGSGVRVKAIIKRSSSRTKGLQGGSSMPTMYRFLLGVCALVAVSGAAMQPFPQLTRDGRRNSNPMVGLMAAAPKKSAAAAPAPGFDIGKAASDVAAASKDFLLGAVSGGVASLLVFPIDLAKTRIQNQKIVAGAEAVYKNAFQTIFKVATTEGFPALYNGVAPVLIGAAPESALQIGMNDKAKAYFAKTLNTEPENIPLRYAIIAGACGGVSQVIVTNPMERVKVLQQVMGKSGGSVVDIVKKIGVSGLYQGSKACFLRDIPFGAIYFPTYTNTKKLLVSKFGGGTESKPRKENWLDALTAGLIAGVPAAGLTTPCDVIKTRMQTGGVGNNAAALGLRATIRSMWVNEGASSFFKGLGPRVGRVAPQLAIALCVYEGLNRLFPTVKPAPTVKAAKSNGKSSGKR